MNLLKQIKSFWALSYGMSSTAVNLYNRLLDINNRLTRRDEFLATNAELMVMTGIHNHHTLELARNELKRRGFIDYQSQGKGRPAIYSLPLLYDEGMAESMAENANVSANVSANINKVKVKGKDNTTTTHAREESDNLINSPPANVPTLAEVKEYAKENGLAYVKPVDFWQHYEAGNWRDEGGNPFNWRQKLLKWNRRDAERKINASSKPSSGSSPPVDEPTGRPSGKYAYLYLNPNGKADESEDFSDA